MFCSLPSYPRNLSVSFLYRERPESLSPFAQIVGPSEFLGQFSHLRQPSFLGLREKASQRFCYKRSWLSQKFFKRGWIAELDDVGEVSRFDDVGQFIVVSHDTIVAFKV